MVKYLRWLLTIVLILGVMTETGIWTALAMMLIFVAIEILSERLAYA